MSFEDNLIVCSDCGITFTFSAGEQQFFQTKALTNGSKRCHSCRRANKAKRSFGRSNTFEPRYESSMYLDIV